MDYLITFLKNNTNLIAYLSLVISICTFFLTRYTNLRFAKYEFIKRQIQEVNDLVCHLNGTVFDVSFTKFSDNGSSGIVYKTNIFEVKNFRTIDEIEVFTDSLICFRRNSNQLLDLKKYINNPFVPINIASELEKFYSFSNYSLTLEQVDGENIIAITSNFFAENDFEKLNDTALLLRVPSAFALQNLENLIVCSLLLEHSIVKWFKHYKVDQINLRSYFWRE